MTDYIVFDPKEFGDEIKRESEQLQAWRDELH